jgi:hypothetical protein
MKTSRVITLVALLAMTTIVSCKKDYTCTCTTVITTGSFDVKHDIKNANYSDARSSCKNYEDQANSSLPGGTTCRL